MPTVSIPADHFFKRAKGEYRDWKRALAREFIQNSIDAGATKIDFTFTNVNDTHFSLAVNDNGRGCSEKVILERLLTLGGTFKDSETAVGGFGAAKELLYFAWPEWRIETRENIVLGAAGSYEIEKKEAKVDGFHAWILVPKSYTSLDELHRVVLSTLKNTQTDAEVTVNGSRIAQEVVTGPRAAKVFDGIAKVYRNKNIVDWYLHIRINGVEMFQMYSGHSKDVGQIIIELQGKSVDLLTSNREGLRSSETQKLFMDFVVALDRSGAKMLKEDKKEADNTMFFNMKPAVSSPPKPDLLEEGHIRDVVGDVYSSNATHIGYGALAGALSGRMAPASILSSFEPVGVPVKAEKVIPTLRPPAMDLSGFDFAIHFRGKPVKAIRVLNKRRTLKLLSAWSVIVREVAFLAGEKIDAVGITLEEETGAECVESGDRRAVLFNPTSKNLGKKVCFEELLSLATHEVAHLKSSNGHDERWATAEINLRRKTFGQERAWKALVKNALKRM